MNKTYPFKWLDESENLIVVNVEVNEGTPLGLKLKNHPVQVIDFIANGIMSNYAGILGMDILVQRNICFNFDKQTLTFS
jgi:hypothetical protein